MVFVSNYYFKSNAGFDTQRTNDKAYGTVRYGTVQYGLRVRVSTKVSLKLYFYRNEYKMIFVETIGERNL